VGLKVCRVLARCPTPQKLGDQQSQRTPIRRRGDDVSERPALSLGVDQRVREVSHLIQGHVAHGLRLGIEGHPASGLHCLAPLIEVDTDLGEPLVAAAEAGCLDCVERLVAAGADVRARVDGQTAAQLARSQGHENVARLLENLEAEERDL
jgi:hypothetical protein